MHQQSGPKIALGSRYMPHRNHGATMNLPELVGVELGVQFAQRGADQAFALLGKDAGVFVIALEVNHFVNGNQAGFIAVGGADPLQPGGR